MGEVQLGAVQIAPDDGYYLDDPLVSVNRRAILTPLLDVEIRA